MEREQLGQQATETVGNNIRSNLEQHNKVAIFEAKKAKIVQETSKRIGAYRSLGAIAAEYQAPGRTDKSMAIPVRAKLNISNRGEPPKERQIYGIVKNDYGVGPTPADMDPDTKYMPNKVEVSFFIRAEEADVASGVFTRLQHFGYSAVNNELLVGQMIEDGQEEFDRWTIPMVHEDGDPKSIAKTDSVDLYHQFPLNPITGKIREVDEFYMPYHMRSLDAELPRIQGTLEMLQEGIKHIDHDAAQRLLVATGDAGFDN